MKKVLFVILGLDFSGAENVLIQYLDGNSEIDPYFAFIYEGNAAQHFNEKFGASKIYQLKLSYIKNELRFLPKITQYRLKHALMTVIEELRPDTLYFNNTHEVILSRKIVRELKVPCIGHVHDMQASIGTICKRYEAKRAFDELDVVLTVSEACKKSWNCNRMKVVYNGVSDDYFTKDKLIEKNDPIVVGYVDGWYLDEDYTQKIEDMYEYYPKNSMTVYAKWTEAYKVTFDACGGVFGSDSSTYSVSVKKGSSIRDNSIYINEPSNGHKVFDGWYLDADYTKPVDSIYSYVPDKNTTIYAKWADSYKVTYDGCGGYFGDADTTTYEVYVKAGEAIRYNYRTPDRDVNDHEMFDGWYLDAEYTQPVDELYSYVPEKDTVWNGL